MLEPGGKIDDLAWYSSSAAPNLLLLHGFTDSAMCWNPLVGAGRLAALAVDARGHGESGLPEVPYDCTDQARETAALLDRLDVGRLAVLGHSMGAATAAHLARLRPDLVQSLVLEDPVLHLSHEPGNRTSADERRAWVREMQSLSLEQRIARAQTEEPGWPADELRPWAVSKGQFDSHVLDLRHIEAELLSDVLPDVRCPILLVRGEPSRGSLVTSEAAASATAGGRLRDVAVIGAGHSVHRDQRTQFLAAIEPCISNARARTDVL